MYNKKIISWNVNGVRAVQRKGFLDWLQAESPDILCIQEVKAAENDIPSEIKNVDGYHTYFSSAEKKGYSGVGIFTKEKPISVSKTFGAERFDSEGRVIAAEYNEFILFNIYFPNGKASAERLAYKMDFYYAFLEHLNKLKELGKGIIICGDVNTAHKEIDLARPKENQNSSGFLPEERAWLDKLIANGFVDTLRIFNNDAGNYTWWDLKSRARERNVGWRIDYFFVSENLKSQIKDAYIMPEVTGSDHCPIAIKMISCPKA